MGPATRLFRFHRGARKFVSVGVPGQVGVLSGILPYAYSVTINWAPPVAFPSFNLADPFLYQKILSLFLGRPLTAAIGAHIVHLSYFD
jgi:hypothetical protein